LVARQGIEDHQLIDLKLLQLLAEPMRSFVVYSLVGEAKTARQLAAELGCPVTRLYHHLKVLESNRLIFVERTRLVSGIRERHYRAAAREFRVDYSGFAPGNDHGRKQRADALLGFVFDQTRHEISRGLAEGRIGFEPAAPMPGSLMAYRNVLKLDDVQAGRLYARLHAFWMEYEAVARQPAAEGRFYSFTVSLHPSSMEAAAASPVGKRVPRRRKTTV
jgi:hypothetical protein